MALWVCAGPEGCGTKYAVGLFTCPRCRNTEFFEDGDPMAKISRHGGASDKTLPADVAPVSRAELRGEPGPELVGLPLNVTDDMAGPAEAVVEGGEESSLGNSSSASTGPQPTSSEMSSQPTRKRARKTANRSEQDQTAASTARSTAGGPEAGTSATDHAAE